MSTKSTKKSAGKRSKTTAASEGKKTARRRSKTTAASETTLFQSYIKSLPATWRPCLEDKWEPIDSDTEPFVILTEEEFNNKYRGKSFVDTFLHNAKAMEIHLNRHGQVNNSMNRFCALVPNSVIKDLVTYTSKQLVADGKQSTNAIELRRHILLSWICNLSNVSSKKLWQTDLARNAVHYKFSLPPHDRFSDLHGSLRGFLLEGRRGDNDDVWNQKRRLFSKLRNIEKSLFEPSLKLMNKNGAVITIDDELVASKDRTIERKTVTDRKRGSEGPVYDGAVDACDNKMYAARLRAKGESEVENMEQLMSTLPDVLTSEQSVKAKFDRGYGKLTMIELTATKGYGILTVAAAAGSKHCFLTQEEVDTKVAELRRKGKSEELINHALDKIKPFILPNENDMGTVMRMAKRTMELDSGKTITLYAVAVHETQDPKKASNWIRLFATGEEVELLKNVVVATKKSCGIDSCQLFSLGKKVVPTRVECEEQLVSNECGPKSLGQRNGGWFLGKSNVVSGTMACHFGKEVLPLDTDEQKQQMLDQCISSWYKRHKSSEMMAQGSDNEVPIAEQISQYDWIKDLYDVGLLEVTSHPYLGVSPDAIARIIVHTLIVLAVVEMKTRLVELTTIKTAEEAAERHGMHVTCEFNDDGMY